MRRIAFIAITIAACGIMCYAIGSNNNDRLLNAISCTGALIGAYVAVRTRQKSGIAATAKDVFKYSWLCSVMLSPLFVLLLGGNANEIGQAAGRSIVIGAVFGGIISGFYGAILYDHSVADMEISKRSLIEPQQGAVISESLSRDERECPWCAELILAKAKVCKHCKHTVDAPAPF